LIVLICVCAVTYCCYSQAKTAQKAGIISTKIVVLKYNDYLDTLDLPDVPDKYPALKNALSFRNICYGDDLQDVIKNFASCECGVTGLSYEVTFESKDILSIIIYTETTGAYLTTSQEWLTFNIGTGQPYPLSNEINAAGRKWIYDDYKKTLGKRILDDKKANPDEDAGEYNDLKTAVSKLESSELLGKYVFTKDGIKFSTERVLPHAVQSLEPDRDLLIPYSKLKEFKAATAGVLK
jgi:hypothetical protein